MKKLPRIHRIREISRIRGDLERDGFPRLQMFLLVTITGAAGFIASYTFLRAGFTEMWLRYLVSFGIAYLVFLLLLWLWLRTRAEDYNDIPDITGSAPSPSGADSPGACYSGNGGDFGGGGASGNFDLPAADVSGIGDAGSSVGDALGSVADAEEFAIPLVVVILIAGLLLSSLFVVYSAPTLFAELLIDGVLSASLYRRLRGLETRHWLETAIRRTAWPFVLTAAIVSASGWAMKLYSPEAHSIGDVIAHSKRAD